MADQHDWPEAATLRTEYLVIHAPGWPGGYYPVPQTWESALDFVRENGGMLRRRLVTDWQDVEVPDA